MRSVFTRAFVLVILYLTIHSSLNADDTVATDNSTRRQVVNTLERQLKQLREEKASLFEIENLHFRIAAAKKLVVIERESVLGFDAISRDFYNFMDGSSVQISGPPLEATKVLKRRHPFVNYSGEGIKQGDPRWGTYEDGKWRWYYRELEAHEVLSPNQIALGRLPKWFILEKDKARKLLAKKLLAEKPKPKPEQPKQKTRAQWIKELDLTRNRPGPRARIRDPNWGVYLEEEWMWYRRRTKNPLIPPVIDSPKMFEKHYSRRNGGGVPVGSAPPR